MAAVCLPDLVAPAPSLDRAGDRPVDLAALERELRRRVDGEVRLDDGTLAAYSTDASNYRQLPLAVVVPRTINAAVAAIAVCAEFGAPVLSRGGGTSLAGQCCNRAVMIDWAKYCNRIESIDAQARTAIVQPGVVLDQLNAAAGEHGLMFGPKPATHQHCTVGGMIGNNSCGATAQTYGKTVDNLGRLEVLCYDGTRFWVGGDDAADANSDAAADAADTGTGTRAAELRRGLRAIAEEYGDEIRERFVDIPRRVSGYNLDSLLPENGFDLAKALCGSESTLVTILRAEVTLVPVVPAKVSVVLGYPSLADAADAVPGLLPFEPLQLEAFDDSLVERERSRGTHAAGIAELPSGRAWLVVELGGADHAEALDRAERLAGSVGAVDSSSPAPPAITTLDTDESQHRLMSFREDALAAAANLEGCCGLAGNFGSESGHLAVSLAVAETELLPAVRNADARTLMIADGFSCRTQLEQSGVGRQAMHLAEVLAAGLRGAAFEDRAELGILERPGRPHTVRARHRDTRPFVRRADHP